MAFAHLTWWPSFVVKLDAKGGATLQFVNSGHIVSLDYIENKTGQYLLAAGTNNEYNSAMLAVLREDQALVASPQSPGSIYQSSLTAGPSPNWAGQWPYRYFLFAPSELFRLTGGTFHMPRAVTVHNSTIEFLTYEGADPLAVGPYLPGVYELSQDFNLMSASFAGDYWSVHRQMEREGKINHSAAQCPDQQALNHVRVWAGEKGWEFAAVRVAKSDR